jgi:predicted membrane protein (TIGR00267 family)
MLLAGIFTRENTFPLVVGPIDGILTALTLAAGRISAAEQPIDISLAVRIGLAASLSGGFVFFVAEYARRRGELVHAERHLNLSSAGQLAASKLGRAVLLESLWGTLIAALTSLAGAMLPLSLGAAAPHLPWITIAVAIAALGAFGTAISRAVQGRPLYWALALMGTGGLLTVAGVLLHVT